MHGTLRAEDHEVALANATLTGNRIRFTSMTEDRPNVFRWPCQHQLDARPGGGARQDLVSRYDWAAQREAANADARAALTAFRRHDGEALTDLTLPA